jgi:succinate dehydrogenase flavin-adding protein (antitoxin of CptAB toxin-antitoxin module)
VYQSKPRGFLELDLVLGTWVEQHVHSMDEANIRALLQVLDLVGSHRLSHPGLSVYCLISLKN